MFLFKEQSRMLQNNITSVTVFVLSILVLGVHNLDYSDLEALGRSCPDRDKCEGYRNNLTYTERSCECDSACDTYNDCCIDVTEKRSDGVRNGPRNGMICMQYGREQDHTGVYVIANCSSTWNGSIQLRRKCEGPIEFTDPVNAVPVVSMPQRVAYRNRYCAECNDANMENLMTFQLKLACGTTLSIPEAEILAGLTYNQELSTWGINRFDSGGNVTDFIGCKVLFEVPGYLNRSVRFCRSNIISTCPPSYTRQTIRKGCEDYMAVVYGMVHAYKNPHCAICNNITVQQVACANESLARRPNFPLSLLFDLNRDSGDEVGNVIVSNPECPSGRIYDPFVKICRRIGCALPGYVVVNRKCVRG